jgi:hypothetical protein
MKTVTDYLNDPRITGDPQMMNVLPLIRELHAIRLKQQDATTGMSAAELAEYHRKKTAELFAGTGFTPQYATERAGAGRIAQTTKTAAGQ